jgi:hypothetical protein
MPGLEVIVGNEMAYKLVRTGSEHPFTGPEPACGNQLENQESGQGLDDQKSQKNTGKP